jgi:chromosome partitioning protein
VIAVALQKGGVGKTTTTQHLSHALAAKGRQVLMLDLDPQGSLTQRYTVANGYTLADAFGEGERPAMALRDVVTTTHIGSLYLAPGGSPLTKSNRHLDREGAGLFFVDQLLNDEPLPFDYVVIDTPPGTSALLVAALVASDEVVIPVQLSPMGFEGFKAIDETIQYARTLQEIRGEVRLVYRAVVPTFYASGQTVSDSFLDVLRASQHPDYNELPLPVSEPVVQTTRFEQASAPRMMGDHRRALDIWEMPTDDVVRRAGDAYLQLAEFVDDR